MSVVASKARQHKNIALPSFLAQFFHRKKTQNRSASVGTAVVMYIRRAARSIC